MHSGVRGAYDFFFAASIFDFSCVRALFALGARFTIKIRTCDTEFTIISKASKQTAAVLFLFRDVLGSIRAWRPNGGLQFFF